MEIPHPILLLLEMTERWGKGKGKGKGRASRKKYMRWVQTACNLILHTLFTPYLRTLATRHRHTLLNTTFARVLSTPPSTGACRRYASFSSAHVCHVRTVGANHSSKRRQARGQRDTGDGAEAPGGRGTSAAEASSTHES